MNEIYKLIEELYPICRSITGKGTLQTLKEIQNIIPIKIEKVKTGFKAFDWVVPREWNIKDAYIKDLKGNRVIDFNKSNIHVVNYSIPIKKRIKTEELRKHLHYLNEHPNWIPYLTTYYNSYWGFCLSKNQYKKLKDKEYNICIDSKLKDGNLYYGELLIKGKTKEEILLTTYCCHPSLCNDNLSGTSLLTYLAKYILNKNNYYSYRILFIPETIGAIVWIKKNIDKLKSIKYGLTITCVGDKGDFTYKKTKDKNCELNKIVEKVLKEQKKKYKTVEFFPLGSDERQFATQKIKYITES